MGTESSSNPPGPAFEEQLVQSKTSLLDKNPKPTAAIRKNLVLYPKLHTSVGITFKVFLASNLEEWWTNTVAPSDQGANSDDQYAFAHPVSDVFQNMSLGVSPSQYFPVIT